MHNTFKKAAVICSSLILATLFVMHQSGQYREVFSLKNSSHNGGVAISTSKDPTMNYNLILKVRAIKKEIDALQKLINKKLELSRSSKVLIFNINEDSIQQRMHLYEDSLASLGKCHNFDWQDSATMKKFDDMYFALGSKSGITKFDGDIDDDHDQQKTDSSIVPNKFFVGSKSGIVTFPKSDSVPQTKKKFRLFKRKNRD